MPPSRRKGSSKSAAAAAAARRQWKVGDLVLAKVKGFPAWPATVSEPEKWGYSTDWKKVLVYFFGTQQIAFCNPADVESFTEEKKQSLLIKPQGKGSDFVRAVQEIIDSYEKSKKQDQVDVINSGDEATLTNAGNSVDSSANVSLKDQTETPEATLDSRSNASCSARDKVEPSAKVEDTAAATQINALHGKESLSERITDDVVSEKPLITTYTSRKRSVGLRSQSCGTQRRALPVRRSRSSSRYQNFVKSCNADEKSAGEIETNVVRDICSRMNKQNRKSPDVSDVDSTALVSNCSIEDNGSEIATVESDTFSLNEGSTIDSGCVLEHSETAVECLVGDFELSKGLDLQIKTVVIKKKRKPNRKRVTNDAAKSAARLDSEAGFKVEVHNNSQSSQNASEKLNENYSKEDGDEHLPLVKRARVRMGKIPAVDELNSSQTEAKPLKDVAVNLSEQIIVPLEIDCDGPVSRNSLLMEGASDSISPSKGCLQLSENIHQHMEVKKNQSFGCSADGESALPPSKRLHRALEAMSANVAEEGQACNEASSTLETFTSGCGSSMRSCTHVAMESKAGNGLQLQGVDSLDNNACQVGASGFSTSVDLIILEEPTKSPLGVDIYHQTIRSSRSQKHEICKKAMEFNDGKDLNEPSFGAHTIQTVVKTQSPGYLSPNLDRSLASLRSCQSSLDQSLPSKDEGNNSNKDLDNGNIDLDMNNYIADNSDKDLGTSEHTGVISDPVSGDIDFARVSPQNGTDLLQYCAEGTDCENTMRLKLQIDDNSQANCPVNMCEVVKKVENKEMLKSTTFASDEVDMCSKDGSGVQSSPSPTGGVHSPARMSPPNTSICNSSASDSVADEERKDDSVAIQKPRSVGKWGNYAEARTALSSFGAMLETLTRTKEIIVRATRLAIDCAKFGNAVKVVEILARTLESESSLHRRVDLFFLVDSIAQCARGLKGDTGGIYLSAIQAVLPRLLLAAAPPGHTAQENRRQCLKVLRVWLERRIFSESVIRHHMRELDSLSIPPSGAFSRRTLRTERALDDPVRDMEGMLVDEYGSNSSFQLPGFCMPRMLKHEDEGSDSDESFEAVTPEHNIETPEEREADSTIDKHRHILEDVDGELEMEDVAPSYEVDMNSTSSVTGVDSAQTLQNQFDQHFAPPFAPPLPQDVPPSSPPPPPLPPPCATSNPYPNGVDSNIYTSIRNMQDNLRQPVTHQSVAPRINPTISDTVHYHAPECRDPQIQTQKQDSASFGNFPVPVNNNFLHSDGAPFHNKTLPPWPPHPVSSDQFSYVQSNQHVKSWSQAPPYHYPNRSHSAHNMDTGNHYNNHDRMKQAPYELHGNWRFPAPPCSGPRYPSKAEGFYAAPYVGPPCEPTRLPNQGWAFPGQTMNHRDSVPFRPPPEAPGFWRPR